MSPLIGTGTDPTPYFALAYGLGFLGIVTVLVWTVLERRKLRALLAAVKKAP